MIGLFSTQFKKRSFIMKLRKFFCILFALSIAVTCIGCTDKTGKESEKEHRPQYEKEEAKTFVDEDHLFDYKKIEWDGPQEYTIVYPKGDSALMKSAETLKSYYKETLNIDVPMVADNASDSEKEILIGKTNRAESSTSIAEGNINVSVKGKKLVFDAGHSVTVDSAVNKFVRLSPKVGEAYTFEISTDFKSEVLDGYKYVWGDEFEGDGLDNTKWALIEKMGGNTKVEVSREENVIDVNEGRLKLHALRYFNNEREGTEYRVPCSVVTQTTMNYVYGYAEIRARIPFSRGCWASFWAQTTDQLKGTRNKDYMVEVDIFELASTLQLTSNLHKWYSAEFDYNSKYNNGINPGVAVSKTTGPLSGADWTYKMEDREGLTYEYHTYGFEWTPTEMSMFIDGEKYHTFDITKSFDDNPDMSGFHDPLHIIFNNHVFIDGISNASASIELSPESLPACYYIDYFRLYQKPNVGELYLAK